MAGSFFFSHDKREDNVNKEMNDDVGQKEPAPPWDGHQICLGQGSGQEKSNNGKYVSWIANSPMGNVKQRPVKEMIKHSSKLIYFLS